MEVFLGFVILIVLIDIEDKLKKMKEKDKKNHFNLNSYLHKKVYIVVDNDAIQDAYLFSSSIKTLGEIIDYDDTWLIFCYYDKSKRKNTTQYLRIRDVKSINEIK